MKKEKRIYDVVVVGGGASGMVSAISAARNGAKVLILEHMESIGKKILATGNGKCNYTNRKQGVSHYRGDDPDFLLPVMEQFGFSDTVAFFEELGICPKERNGYFYPASEQASSVLEVLQMELRRLAVEIRCEIGIRSILKENNIFALETKTETFYGKSCVLATGGYAAKKTGSDGSGFIYAKKLGHHLSEPVPALVQLIAKQPFEKEMAGVRIHGEIRLFAEKEFLHKETGEIQLTDYGISGIPTFQVSRFAAKALAKGKNVTAVVDFFPEKTKEEFTSLLNKRFYQYGKGKNVRESLIGLFSEKLIPVFLKRAGINEKQSAIAVEKKQLCLLCKQIKQFKIEIERTNKFDAAQVTAGGILTEELEPETLSSRFVEGLFFAGEMIDIDGECGGYNLQWAWSSGAVAGKAAAEFARRK